MYIGRKAPVQKELTLSSYVKSALKNKLYKNIPQFQKGTGRSLFGDGVFLKKPRPQTEIDSFCLLQILSKHGSLNQ